MTKKQFLKNLKDRLQVLNEQEIDDILKEYEGHIDMKMKKGLTEEESIKDFGDMDSLVKEILKAYKISENYTTNQSPFERFINNIVDKIVDFFNDFMKLLSTQKGEDIIRVIFKVIIILIMIWLLKLPFLMIEGLGKMILKVIPTPFYFGLSSIWVLFMRFAYIVAGIILLYVLIKKIINGEEVTKEELQKPKGKLPKKKKDEIKEEKRESSKVKQEGETNYTKMLLKPLFVCLQILVVIMSIPLVMFIVGLAIALGVMICFLFQGIYLISLFCIVIGLLLISSSILGLIYHLTFKKRGEIR